MLCRYFNGARVLAVCRASTQNSTPRRSSRVGRLQGADGTAYSIPGNRSSPEELESADDHGDSALSWLRWG